MLTNKNLKLRALEPSDATLIYEWENNCKVWRTSNTFSPFSRRAIETYINESINLDIFTAKQLRLMIDRFSHQGKQSVGMVDLFDFDFYNKRAGVGILIDEKQRRRGYAQETLSLLEDYAFDFLHLHQLHCTISETNTGSLKLFENAGFTITGTQHDWHITENGYENIYFLQKIKGK